jgi:hypothetical protein
MEIKKLKELLGIKKGMILKVQITKSKFLKARNPKS